VLFGLYEGIESNIKSAAAVAAAKPGPFQESMWVLATTSPVTRVVSMGRRNTFLKFTRRSLKT
jgi:hypothetical protein